MYPQLQPLLDELTSAKAALREVPNEPRFSHRRLKARLRVAEAEGKVWQHRYNELCDRS